MKTKLSTYEMVLEVLTPEKGFVCIREITNMVISHFNLSKHEASYRVNIAGACSQAYNKGLLLRVYKLNEEYSPKGRSAETLVHYAHPSHVVSNDKLP